MIAPTALNTLIVAAMMVIVVAFWRAIAIRYADTNTGQAMSVFF